MPRYVIERTFEDDDEPLSAATEEALRRIREANARDQAIWIHSYVSTDHRRMFCVYDAPSPEAVRHASAAAGLPVESITEVSVIDPYFRRLADAGRER